MVIVPSPVPEPTPEEREEAKRESRRSGIRIKAYERYYGIHAPRFRDYLIEQYNAAIKE